MSKQPISVSQLTLYIKDIIEEDVILNSVYVKGEISNFKHHSSGHMYFTLKDEGAKIKCVMFKGHALFLKFIPEEGMRVIIQGNVSVYERDGQYQLYCQRIEPDGIGSLYLAFEQLKERLSAQGLFDVERKKAIPVFPRRIGVATSPTGSVIRDIINVSCRRFNGTNILLYPVKVQGDGASRSIVDAIKYFNTRDDIDVIIIGRGGGSIEELWAFNEEDLAIEISRSRIPIISAVGHETDFTIADFVADLRASTPSHAAEIAVPSYEELKYKIKSLSGGIKGAVCKSIDNFRYSVRERTKNIEHYSPQNRLVQYLQYIDGVQNSMMHSVEKRLLESRNSYSSLIGKIDALSPLKTLSRGYTYIEIDGHVINSIENIEARDKIKLHMQDGTAYCEVLEKREGDLWQLGKRK